MRIIILHSFRLKYERTGNWYTSRYKMTIEEAISGHGTGNFELIEGTAVVHYVSDYPKGNSTAHVIGSAK